MFIPTTKKEMEHLGWNQLDVIFVSGDTYIDYPGNGTALLGKLLISKGYKVGIICQPDIKSCDDITRLGEPSLFWGVSSGSVDSMVANYTALKKPKRKDDLTPGGNNDKRPDRAVIAYTNLIKQNFKNTKPIVIGGIEASLRRLSHYDYWDDKIRRSILFDSKADVLVYGMAERTIVELAGCLKNGMDIKQLRGLCCISKDVPENYLELPSFEEVSQDKLKFIEMFNKIYKNNNPLNAKGLVQKHGDRFLVHNPPAYYLSTGEMDEVFKLDFERDVHPYYRSQGEVRGLKTVQFSVSSHYGCFGECNFCSITVHQGRKVISRSKESIINEVKKIVKHVNFKGYISDVGGPTANMYAMSCNIQNNKGSCKNRSCISEAVCKELNIDHANQIELLKELKKIPGIKKVFIASGIRYDLIIEDKASGEDYMFELVENHVSGQLKIAPEHTIPKVLNAMGKPADDYLHKFKQKFYEITRKSGKNQFLTYYFIAAHPGCELDDMRKLKDFIKKEIKINPEQVQIFTPTPSTYSSLMYYTGLDPKTMKSLFVEKKLKNKHLQKVIITG